MKKDNYCPQSPPQNQDILRIRIYYLKNNVYCTEQLLPNSKFTSTTKILRK